MVLDARKAHMHAMAERPVYVQLPPERRRPGVCARLRRVLYGCRDAPALWDKFVAQNLAELGFIQGAASTCLYSHRTRGIAIVVNTRCHRR